MCMFDLSVLVKQCMHLLVEQKQKILVSFWPHKLSFTIKGLLPDLLSVQVVVSK